MRRDNWPVEPAVSVPGLRSPRAAPRGHGQASPAPLAFTVPLCWGKAPLEKESQRKHPWDCSAVLASQPTEVSRGPSAPLGGSRRDPGPPGVLRASALDACLGRLHQTTPHPHSFLLKALCPEVGSEAPLWVRTFPAAWGWEDIAQK